MLTQQNILDALRSVHYPGYSRDVVSFGLVKNIAVNGGARQRLLPIDRRQCRHRPANQRRRRKPSCAPSKEWNICTLRSRRPRAAQAPAQAQTTFESEKRRARRPPHGRGGQRQGRRGQIHRFGQPGLRLAAFGRGVGLLDCDIYGPSIPLMMGMREKPTVSAAEKLVPPSNHGVKLMSMGFLIEGDAPVIWRGPMIMKTIQQFISEVEWGGLDYLLVDLPPGTGDAQLSLCQTVPLDGGVIVTTPQEASLGVVRKGHCHVREGQRADPWHR